MFYWGEGLLTATSSTNNNLQQKRVSHAWIILANHVLFLSLSLSLSLSLYAVGKFLTDGVS
jgi:hypothetical protein